MGGISAYHLLAMVYHHTQPNQTYQFPNSAGSQVRQLQDLQQDLHQPLLPNVSRAIMPMLAYLLTLNGDVIGQI